MAEKTLYITDLDGTLLNSQQQLSPDTVRVINGLVERGLLFSFATARSLSTASVVTRGLSLKLPVVLNNGVFLTEPSTGEICHVAAMDQARVAGLLEIMESGDISALVYALINGREQVSWLRGRETQGILNYLGDRAGDERLREVDQAEQLLDGDVFYITIIEAEEKARLAHRLLDGEDSICCNLSNDIYRREEWWVELYRHDVSKAAAIERLRKLVGADRVVCFGDNLNDLPMFHACAEAYAVANAESEVKAAATAVIASNEEDGVARWLEEYGIIAE